MGQALAVVLQNQTSSDTVYPYVTGIDVNTNALVFLEADGQILYYPNSPPADGAPLAVNCAIPLGQIGSQVVVTIPQPIAARIYFCINDTLTFLLNPGPQLAQPSVSDPSDPNINKTWDFCELTFNPRELFANITYVYFVCIPIALSLANTSGVFQTVPGLPVNGLDTIISNAIAQDNADHAGWSQLIYSPNGANLRVVRPNQGVNLNPSLFSGYYAAYVNACWEQYTNSQLTIDTQGEWRVVNGQVINGLLTFRGVGTFTQPSTADIWSCSTGPFANFHADVAEMGAITTRLTAALNRTTLLIDSNQPDGENPSNYYVNSPTNQYARIVHAANLDSRGYAFPYDDVVPTGGADQSGAVYDQHPASLTVVVGGS